MGLGFMILVVGDCGGYRLVVFFFFFWWWWLAMASCGCDYGCGLLGLRKKW